MILLIKIFKKIEICITLEIKKNFLFFIIITKIKYALFKLKYQ